MAATSGGKVVYVPNPNPHPQAGDAPGTGVPTNPVPPRGIGNPPTVPLADSPGGS